MKKNLLILVMSGFVLSACGGGVSELRADCDTLATDPEAQEKFAEIGMDNAQFCDCFVKVVEAKPADDQNDMKMALSRVTDGMADNNGSAEDTVGPIMSEAMADPDNAEAQSIVNGVQLIGSAIDDVQDGFEDGGSCPVS